MVPAYKRERNTNHFHCSTLAVVRDGHSIHEHMNVRMHADRQTDGQTCMHTRDAPSNRTDQ